MNAMTTYAGRALAAACTLWAAGAAHAVGEPYDVVATSYPSAVQASLNWQADGADLQGFRIERRIAGSRAWIAVASLNSAVARSWVDGGLRYDTAYEYRVTALRTGSPAGGSPSLTAVLNTPSPTATQPDYDAAAAPRNLDAQPLAARSILLAWTDVTPDETGFRVERRAPGGNWSALGLTAPNVRTWRDDSVQPATSYEYRVFAERSGQVALPSLPKTATTPAAAQAFTIKFVDAVNGLDTNAGTEAAPYKTIQRAADVVAAGGTVLVRAGLYTRTNGFAVVAISRSGLATSPTTYKAYPGERPKVRTTKGLHYAGFDVRHVEYVVVDGFEIEGHLNDVTVAEADAAYATHKATGKTPGPVTSSCGVSVEGRIANQPIPTPHHIVLRNLWIHDHPLCGIGAMGADYLTVENNRISNVGRYSTLGGSGISFQSSKPIDGDTTTPKMIIRNNVVSEAINDYPCNCYSFKQPTDGNGIIIDVQTAAGYFGKTVIANNIVFNNGGRGIHVYKSNNVDVLFNTTVRNSTKEITGDGEITSQNSTNVRVYNNIMAARTDRPLNLLAYAAPADAATVDFNFNVMLGGNRYTASTGLTGGANNRVADPQFIAETGPQAHRLKPTSPALNSAWNGVAAPATDAYLAPRPRGGVADVGAVESF